MSVKSATGPVILATGGYDHTIRFWEALSGQCIRVLQHPESQINSMAITKDKRFLAAAGNPKIQLVDVAGIRNEPIHVFEGHTNNVTAVGFQKDFRWMYSSSEDGTLKVWDIRTAKCQRTFECSKKGTLIHSVILHPNQVDLYCCDHFGNIRLWNLTNNTCEMIISLGDPSNSIPIRSLTISMDGTRLIASTHSGYVYIWSIPFRDSSNNQSDSHILSKQWQAHDTFITKCLASPDGLKLATASADHTVKLWNIKDNDSPSLQTTLVGHQKWVWDCVFSADSAYLITASSDNTSRLWNVQDGRVIREYLGHDKAIVAVAMNDLPI